MFMRPFAAFHNEWGCISYCFSDKTLVEKILSAVVNKKVRSIPSLIVSPFLVCEYCTNHCSKSELHNRLTPETRR
jgi:hypothetical protein